MRRVFGLISGLALAMGAAGPASAITYAYTVDSPSLGNAAGSIETFFTQYDTTSAQYSLSISVAANNGVQSDGFWSVTSPGPNPKGIADELAILYADGQSGELWAYEYNGVNGFSSFSDPSKLIAYYPGAVSTMDDGALRTFTISGLDASAIQTYSDGSDWTGLGYADLIGVWIHPVDLEENGIEGDENGINAFPVLADSFYDTLNQPTEIVAGRPGDSDVPEPAAIALVAAGLGGLWAVRRRRKASDGFSFAAA
ncbi:MAG: VPLPA-CTERM sorting domain-containing protein [Pseudomonadota bacterium]